ncbi:MAG: DUF4920 domain-containing protein [Deltaproteobacteria bacterium]|nr:DUF4920 domain-containing protein [Deltaproteobacteria bacterium]
MRAIAVVPSLFVAVSVVGCSTPAPAGSPEGAVATVAHADEGKGESCEADKKSEPPVQQAAAKPDRDQVDADGVIRRGAKLSEGAALTVVDAVAKAADLDGKNVKITGRVDSVCQAMGCWFTLANDGGPSIRISSKGHDIFVPRGAAGRVATVEGEFKVKTLSKEQAQHFEDERPLKAGETRKTFTEDVKELSLAITAVEMTPAT